MPSENQETQSCGDTMHILDDVKNGMGVDTNNLAFDHELLLLINATVQTLVQIGVSDFEGVEVDATTEWPIFATPEVKHLVRFYVLVNVRLSFDPSASDTINRNFQTTRDNLEGRIGSALLEAANV